MLSLNAGEGLIFLDLMNSIGRSGCEVDVGGAGSQGDTGGGVEVRTVWNVKSNKK